MTGLRNPAVSSTSLLPCLLKGGEFRPGIPAKKSVIHTTIFLFSLCHVLLPSAHADSGIGEVSVKLFLNEDRFARTNTITSTAYKVGLSLGGALRYDIGEWFAIQPELVYASRGSRITLDGSELSQYRLRYLELPVLLRATLPTEGPWYAYFVAGPSTSYLLGASTNDSSSTKDIKEDLTSFDFSGIAGIGGTYELESRWAVSIDVRYAAGIRQVFAEPSPGVSTKNRAILLSFGVGYVTKDGDRDGVTDRFDACPMQVEDRDDFEDQDGCPDADNDQDGLADEVDRCPIQGEDIDEFEDGDGCPDPDNDGDGFLDQADQCVDQAFPRNDGCPPTYELARVEGNRIVLASPLAFDNGSAELAEAHKRALDQVAGLLDIYYPDMRLRVEGHADGEGSKAKNDELSEQRAKRVYEYLTLEKKIDRDRLEVVGHGERRPLAYEKDEAGKRKNRRVELMILEGL